jgi:CBS domain-containing protein
VDVAAFLGRHPPFDQLPPEQLEQVARTVKIEFFPAGAAIAVGEGEAAGALPVVRSGAVEILEDGRLLDLAGEGEMLEPSGLEGARPVFRAHEDTLMYLVDRPLVKGILEPRPLVRTVSLAKARIERTVGDLRRRRVDTLVHRPPVTCEGHATVRQAATLMARERISSILVPSGTGWGILTDRDLRSRVAAQGRGLDTRVEEVMSFPARTVSADTMAGEVLMLMLEEGFHHFPIVDAGRLVGVVSDTDLLGLELTSPFSLKADIERSETSEAVAAAAGRLKQTVCALVETGADPIDVGHIVGVTIDALTRRLIELATISLGDPPVPWAWLALGSQARHEQALHTDQDHALAFDSGNRPAHHVETYFAELAESVTDGLEAASIPRCKGGAMAVHPLMRRTLAEWQAAFRGWMDDPGIEGSVFTSIVFDYRRVAGPLEVERPLDGVIRLAPEHFPQFVRHLAHRALDRKPPTGFFRDLVVEAEGEHAGTLDLKHGGIMIVTNLGRAYSIRGGRSEKRTLQRLAGAVESGLIPEVEREALEEAFRFVWRVRVEHQAHQVREGVQPDDYVDPAELGPIERRGLKEAFRIIARSQRALSTGLMW